MAIAWDDGLLVGNEMIDSQHKEFIVRLNAILDASRANKSREEMAPFLDYLAEYVNHHFTSEEKLMAELGGNDGFPLHKMEHVKFKEALSQWRARYEATGHTEILARCINTWVVNWLVIHLRGYDLELAKVARARNPQ